MDPAVDQTQQSYSYAGENPVNVTDPNGLCWSLAPGVAGPCTSPPPGVPYGGSFTPTEIAQYPQVLEGMNPEEVLNQLGWDASALPPGWAIDPAGSSSMGAGTGWRLYTLNNGGIQIRWSPGSLLPGHSSDPYWTVSSGKYQITAGNSAKALGPPIPAGGWDQPPYATPGAASRGGGGGCIPGDGGTQTVGCIIDPFPFDTVGLTTLNPGTSAQCYATEPVYIL